MALGDQLTPLQLALLAVVAVTLLTLFVVEPLDRLVVRRVRVWRVRRWIRQDVAAQTRVLEARPLLARRVPHVLHAPDVSLLSRDVAGVGSAAGVPEAETRPYRGGDAA